MPFSIVCHSKDGTHFYAISGYLDENTKFPPFPSDGSQIQIDLNGVKGLNSIGTRGWCSWIATAPQSAMALENCPPIFVKAFNNVVGALTPKMRVQSVLVPYISETNNKRKDVLFKRGEQFFDDGKLTEPKVLDEQGQLMEMDVMPDYFRFLKS